MSLNSDPKLSVCIVTYNHEKYIRQCLQSIIDQQTDFNFEVIVADDCSTDSTREIIDEFANVYPDVIRVFIHKNNIGPYKNFIFVHQMAKGEYIAHLDGDDIALPGKLQLQVDYLDKNVDCSVVWHAMYILDDFDGSYTPNSPDLSGFTNGVISLSDMLTLGSFVYHSSTMYRANARTTKSPKMKVIDWFYNVEYLESGYGKYFGDPYGVYRINQNNSISSGDGAKAVRKIYFDMLNYYLNKYPEYKKNIFINCILYMISDIRHLKVPMRVTIRLLWKARSWVDIRQLVLAIRKSIAVRKLG